VHLLQAINFAQTAFFMNKQSGNKTWLRLRAAILISMVALAMIAALMKAGIIEIFENKLYDWRFWWRGKQTINTDVVLVGIDDLSTDILGRWPWMTREFYCSLLKSLSKYPPKFIGFDLLFRPRQETAGDTSDETARFDRLFPQMAMLFDVAPGVGYNFYFPEEGRSNPPPEGYERELQLLERFRLKRVSGISKSFPFVEQASLPYRELAEVANLGFLNAPRRDSDGVLRELPLVIGFRKENDQTRFYPSLGLLGVLHYYEGSPDEIEVQLGRQIRFIAASGKQIRIPIDRDGFLKINFAGRISDFESVPFAQVISWGQRGDFDNLIKLKDKILIVGLTATGSSDVGPIPIEPNAPLALAHLNAINSILLNRYVIVSPVWIGYGLLALLAFSTSAISCLYRPRSGLLLTAAMLIFYVAASLILFFSASIIIPIFAPVLAIVLIYMGMLFYRYLTEEKQKLWIKKVLRQYLPQSVMEELLDNPEKLTLGGERRELTVLFSDVQAFTAFCEKKSPEEVVHRLNQYMDAMTEAIFNNSGTLDKYVGDAIVAFFGAPGNEHRDDHAEHAVRAALEMQRKLLKLQQQWEHKGEQVLNAGIGLNTGQMLVGNMGSTNVFDYTVVGDEVNLGARVEALTRKYNVPIIITESTRKKVEHLFQTKQLGEETVKGRQKPVKVYTILGEIKGNT